MGMASDQFHASIAPAFEAYERSIKDKEPEEILQLRRKSIAQMQTMAFPTLRNEEWKYTNMERVLKQGFSLATNRKGLEKGNTKFQEVLEQLPHRIVFVDGKYDEELSNFPNTTDLKITIGIEQANGFASKLDSIADPEFYFSALNTGFTQEPIFIEAKGAIEEPLHIVYETHSIEQLCYFPRVFIHAKGGSELKIAELYLSNNSAEAWHNSVTEIDVQPNAKLSYDLIQIDAPQVHHTGQVQVNIQRNARFSASTVTLGGGITRNDLNLRLQDQHAEGNMFGLYLTHGDMHVDNHTSADHIAPNAYSNELYKGILSDNSTAVFNGKIFVRQQAQKTLAFQSNHNLLLSEKATINTKPQLEIWADDVKCSHGATTGKLDEDSLFYLQSRGLSKPAARKMLLQAYAGELVEKIASKALAELVNIKLDGLFVEK